MFSSRIKCPGEGCSSFLIPLYGRDEYSCCGCGRIYPGEFAENIYGCTGYNIFYILEIVLKENPRIEREFDVIHSTIIQWLKKNKIKVDAVKRKSLKSAFRRYQEENKPR